MDSPESRNDNSQKIATFELLHFVLQIIGAIIIIMMMCWVFIYLEGLSWSSQPKIQFNWHPLLMTIGMIYLYGNCKFYLS